MINQASDIFEIFSEFKIIMTLYSDFTIYNFSIIIETDDDHVMICYDMIVVKGIKDVLSSNQQCRPVRMIVYLT